MGCSEHGLQRENVHQKTPCFESRHQKACDGASELPFIHGFLCQCLECSSELAANRECRLKCISLRGKRVSFWDEINVHQMTLWSALPKRVRERRGAPASDGGPCAGATAGGAGDTFARRNQGPEARGVPPPPRPACRVTVSRMCWRPFCGHAH